MASVGQQRDLKLIDWSRVCFRLLTHQAQLGQVAAFQPGGLAGQRRLPPKKSYDALRALERLRTQATHVAGTDQQAQQARGELSHDADEAQLERLRCRDEPGRPLSRDSPVERSGDNAFWWGNRNRTGRGRRRVVPLAPNCKDRSSLQSEPNSSCWRYPPLSQGGNKSQFRSGLHTQNLFKRLS